MQTAEQVVAALTGGVVSTAVNIPAISAEDMDVLGPFIPLVDRLGAAGDGARRGLERRPRRGRVLRPDRRARHAAADARRRCRACCAATARRTSTSSTRRRWPRSAGSPSPSARRPSRATSPTSCGSRSSSGDDRYRVAGTALGRQDRPHLLEAWGQRFNLQLDEGAHMALFRYCDLPGMMGRVGTVLGERGVNISSAAVGRQPPGADGRRNEVAVMVVTTDSPVPRDVVAEIARSDGFLAGRAVSACRAPRATGTATGRSGSSAPSCPTGRSGAARPRSTSPARSRGSAPGVPA